MPEGEEDHALDAEELHDGVERLELLGDDNVELENAVHGAEERKRRSASAQQYAIRRYGCNPPKSVDWAT